MERDIQRESQTITDFLAKNKLYFIGSETDDSVLIALRPFYKPPSRTISWWDTNVERAKQIAHLHEAGEKGVLFFTDPEENKYRFLPMNLDIYNTIVRPRLNGGREFTDMDELVRAFEDTAY